LYSVIKFKKLFAIITPTFLFKMSDLLDATSWAGNIVVPSQGWLIFGGLGDANFTTAQKLGSVDGIWEVGPALLDNKRDLLQCIVQVKKDTE
jgi:hypothetical protein